MRSKYDCLGIFFCFEHIIFGSKCRLLPRLGVYKQHKIKKKIIMIIVLWKSILREELALFLVLKKMLNQHFLMFMYFPPIFNVLWPVGHFRTWPFDLLGKTSLEFTAPYLLQPKSQFRKQTPSWNRKILTCPNLSKLFHNVNGSIQRPKVPIGDTPRIPTCWGTQL